MILIENLKDAFYSFFDKPCREVIIANCNKLPDKIEISWFRDGKYIIGNIKAEDNTYITQAVSADEFVEMVNDTLLAAYEIPQNCVNMIRNIKKFIPTKEEFEKLNNAAIKKSEYSLILTRDKQMVTA
ncbi:MAG: hypothetical protein Q7K35_02435 [bacterium]|nr:hypothetical protein [bacterium]